MDWTRLWDTLLPARCVACDKPPSPCCFDCQPVADPYSVTRGATAVTVALSLDTNLSKLITGFKDNGQLALGSSLANLASASLERLLKKAQIESSLDSVAISWVPSSRSARAKRGFEANRLLLVKMMSRRRKAGLRTFPIVSVLKHVSRNRDQSGLSRSERFINTEGTFQARFHNQKLLLFDDIVTTGATLDAALAALTRKGCSVLSCFALAETTLRAQPALKSRIVEVG